MDLGTERCAAPGGLRWAPCVRGALAAAGESARQDRPVGLLQASQSDQASSAWNGSIGMKALLQIAVHGCFYAQKHLPETRRGLLQVGLAVATNPGPVTHFRSHGPPLTSSLD